MARDLSSTVENLFGEVRYPPRTVKVGCATYVCMVKGDLVGCVPTFAR
jgi:hypothetical protein